MLTSYYNQQVRNSCDVSIPVDSISLAGELNTPAEATGLVLFAHGSGSSRLSPRNQFVADVLREAGLGTLLFDLLTSEEEAIDLQTRHLRFDIPLPAHRLAAATAWTKNLPETGRRWTHRQANLSFPSSSGRNPRPIEFIRK